MKNLTLGGNIIPVQETEVDQSSLKYYVENPRVYSALVENHVDGTPTQEEIQKYMQKMEHVKELRLSIQSHGGLIEPVFVCNDVVVEGNSRLAAYRLLAEKNPITWGKIKALVLPNDTSEDTIVQLIGFYHINQQKMPWSPFEQAGFLYRRYTNSKKSIKAIAAELQMKESDVKRLVGVYEKMKEHDDMKPERWSYYDELFKKLPKINKTKKSDGKRVETILVEQIKDGKIEQAADIRKITELVIADTENSVKLFDEFVDGEKTLNQVVVEHEVEQEDGATIKKLKQAESILQDENIKQFIKDSNEGEFIAKQIIRRLKNLVGDD